MPLEPSITILPANVLLPVPFTSKIPAKVAFNPSDSSVNVSVNEPPAGLV